MKVETYATIARRIWSGEDADTYLVVPQIQVTESYEGYEGFEEGQRVKVTIEPVLK